MPEAPNPSVSRAAKAAPSREAIAKLAYELYLQRGSESGFELEDWLTAEAELTAAAVAAKRARGSRADAALEHGRRPRSLVTHGASLLYRSWVATKASCRVRISRRG